jgi:hypothetical protein
VVLSKLAVGDVKVGLVEVKEAQVEGKMVAADTLTSVRGLAWSGSDT